MSMNADKIRKLTPEQRKEKLNELRLELSKLQMQAHVGTVDNPGKIKVLRKTIARILTIENEEKRKKG
ncbi:50S ribosomal protein L29 [Fervidicoccus fontis]|uniref:Large ribosomal subunit protein uL29 n=1 Tax=Fervidicoccus fontis TaxID=683846 RepID=A0A2J6N304_9CREN|nr:50S ribosomal protein L29 [Fervidicoccus fontis]PMB75728.1 MAG: 50S ribosomal protein L29 [Fervidicoccus fontis]PMB78114.1 MAG: 50S ribosomal protein L29 [Fervidicoccus fontis]HEW64180.1 50S ribosomal protein L29 [Fervidicoccus fontis]